MQIFVPGRRTAALIKLTAVATAFGLALSAAAPRAEAGKMDGTRMGPTAGVKASPNPVRGSWPSSGGTVRDHRNCGKGFNCYPR